MDSNIKIKKGQIEDYAVQKNGNQTIDGKKTFTINSLVPHTETPTAMANAVSETTLDAVLSTGNTSVKSIILEKTSETNDLAISADGFEFANYGDNFDNLTLKWTTSGDGELLNTEIELPKKSGTLAVVEDISDQVAQEVLNKTLLSSEATLVLTANKTVNYFANTGGATTWTLPPVSGNTGKQIIIVNKGSGNISINTHAGNLELFDGAPLNAMPLITGATYGLYCDGVHWTALY